MRLVLSSIPSFVSAAAFSASASSLSTGFAAADLTSSVSSFDILAGFSAISSSFELFFFIESSFFSDSSSFLSILLAISLFSLSSDL